MDEYIFDLLRLAGMLMCVGAAIQLQERKKRRFKTRPINRYRKVHSGYTYYQNMKTWDLPQFFKYTRMTKPVFDKLLGKIKPRIKKQTRKDGITAEERLVITLQYLSQGMSMQVLAWNFHIGLTTVHQVIHDTCRAIWDILRSEYLKSPSSEEEWLRIAQGFVRIVVHYISTTKRISVVLLASCDSQYRFTMVDIGAYGSQSDGGVFRESIFGQRFENRQFKVPSASNLTTNIQMPYFLMADEAFPLKDYIMRPYGGRNLTEKQRIFNYRLSRARMVIKNTFGIMAARWRILKTNITLKGENVDNVVKAITVLHNYCKSELENEQMYCPPGYVDTGDEKNGQWRKETAGLRSVGRLSTNNSKKELYELRDRLADYFVSPVGEVKWQNDASIRACLESSVRF